MNNHLTTLEPNTSAVVSAVPRGLQITHDVRLRQAQAEMLSRYQLALMLPRDWIEVGFRLLACCDNPDFAKVGYYSKPAGQSKNIEGLSIRFAEEAQRLMRNISVDTSPEMEDELSIHYRTVVTDLESNTPTSETFKVEKTVERRRVDEGTTVLSTRTNSSGDLVHLIPATEDQINTKLRAQMSKVKRTLILALLPAEIRVQCLERCRAVAKATDAKNPQEATKSLVSAFLSLGIEVSDLKEYLGKSPAAMVAKEIEDLRGIYALLRDGEMTWNDVMEAKRETEAAKGSKAEFVAGKKAQRAKDKQKPPRAARASRQAQEPPAAAGSGGGAADAGKASKGKGGATSKTAEPAPPAARASRRGDDEEDEGKAGGDPDSGSNP